MPHHVVTIDLRKLRYPEAIRNSKDEKPQIAVESCVSYVATKTPGSARRKQSNANKSPAAVLKEKANREKITPTLAKVDILPTPGGNKLEFSDSVADEVETERKSNWKNRSILSMMSSLSDTSSVGQLFPPFGDFGDLEEKSQFEVPTKKKSADAPVNRRDREWKRQEELTFNREFKNYQLVKQLAGGASIMRGVSYRRGVKGSSISNRYQANLEKIMFIRNVYENRDFRDTFPRETKRNVKQSQLGLKYQLRDGVMSQGVSPRHPNDSDTDHNDISIPYSFVHGLPEDKDAINANLREIEEAQLEKGGRLAHSLSPNTRQEVRVPMYFDHHISVDETASLQISQQGSVPVNSAISPPSVKPSHQSYRAQKFVRSRQSDACSPESPRIKNEEKPTIEEHHRNSAPGWTPSVPKASELLPEALNLDPSVHLDIEGQIVAQRSPQYKTDDGSATASVSTTMLFLNEMVQQQQQYAPSSARRHLYPHSIHCSDASTTASGSPRSARSVMVGPADSNIVISPTSSVDVTTTAFARSISHHQAFLSSQMRRMKHDTKRQLRQAGLAPDAACLQELPPPKRSPRSVVAISVIDKLQEHAASNVTTSLEPSKPVVTMEFGQAAVTVSDPTQARSPKALKIQMKLQRQTINTEPAEDQNHAEEAPPPTTNLNSVVVEPLLLESAPSTAPHLPERFPNEAPEAELQKLDFDLPFSTHAPFTYANMDELQPLEVMPI
jgi:hypothetical protein